MNNKQILFFATATDIIPIMELIESEFSIKYYEMGLFDEKNDNHYNSISEIPEFAIPKYGDWNKDMRLIAIPTNLSIVHRQVPQKRGGEKFAVDPLENEISLCFQFGGIYREGILLGGSCGTAFLNEFSLAVFKKFSTLIKKEYKKIGTFYVGKNAEKKLKVGWRLVTNEKSPKEYDLALN